MVRSDEAIARLLLGAGVIDQGQLAAARDQISRWGGRLHHVVVEMGFAREDHVARAIAGGTNLPRVALGTVPPDVEALGRLDARLCEEKNVFPCALKDNGATLWLAVSDPTDPDLPHVARLAGVAQIRPVIAGFDEIQDAILRTYRGETQRRWATGEAFARAPLPPRPMAPPAPGFPAAMPVPVAPSLPVPPGSVAAPGFVVSAAAVPPPAPTPPGGWPVPPPEPSGVRLAAAAGTDTISRSLDELLGLAGIGALTPDQLQRLAVVRANQDKLSRILRAIIELCADRGVFTLEGFQARLR